MYSFRIVSAEREFVQDAGAEHIAVDVEILKNEEFFETKRFGYALETTKEEILAELTRLCETLESDERIAVETAERAAAESTANATINSLLSGDETTNENVQ
jgi:hypothetical protein